MIGVGDILEWLAGACLVAAAWCWGGYMLGLLAIAICLGYFAQVYDSPSAPTPPLPPDDE